MPVWRLAKEAYCLPTGEGAYKYGGRWNPPGFTIVYTSESVALAALEALVHADSDLLPDDLIVLKGDIPSTLPLQTVSVNDLPPNWHEIPGPRALHRIEVDWLRANQTVALRVPSAIIAQEHNVLLNPAHPDFARIHWKTVGPFHWDPRLGQFPKNPQ